MSWRNFSVDRQSSITAVRRFMLQRKREKRPPLLPLSGTPAAGSRHDVAERSYNTAKLATGSVRVLLFRMLLPPARGHNAECCLTAAAARARGWNCWHSRGFLADQWRYSTIPTGKPSPVTDQTMDLSRTLRPFHTRSAAFKQATLHLLDLCSISVSILCKLIAVVHTNQNLDANRFL